MVCTGLGVCAGVVLAGADEHAVNNAVNNVITNKINPVFFNKTKTPKKNQPPALGIPDGG